MNHKCMKTNPMTMKNQPLFLDIYPRCRKWGLYKIEMAKFHLHLPTCMKSSMCRSTMLERFFTRSFAPLSVIHNFGCHDDIMMMEKSRSSPEHFPEKKLLLSVSRNNIFKGGSQATYIFAYENELFSQAALS